MIAVSTNYRRLSPAEVPAIAAELDAAWKSPEIPLRQWISVVRSEVERYRDGEAQPHFDILVRAMKRTGLVKPTVLDVGCSSAFYKSILEIGGFPCDYTGLDYSEAYERLAKELYPDVKFKVGDARALPFEDSSFDILLSGCVLLHVANYEAVIAESARVASQFVVMNRTPVTVETTFLEKLAYGCRTLEVWFGEEELLGLFAKYGLEVVTAEDVFSDPETQFGHRTYLLRKANQ